MNLKQLIELIDPNIEGIAWLNFYDKNGILQCKSNTRSSFLSPLYEREVWNIAAVGINEFDVRLKGDI